MSEKPIHISELGPGDAVRIAMKAGRALEPIVQPRSKQNILRPGRASAGGRSLRAKAFSRTVFLGFITQNDPVGGTLTLQVASRDRGNRRSHAEAFVPYKDIQVIRKYITPGPPNVELLERGESTIGGGPSARKRPGILAKGLPAFPGFMNLVRVFF